MKPILETTVEDVRGPLEFSVLGAVAAAHGGARPDAARPAAGTILFTTGGAVDQPSTRARAGVGISFAGEVAYARMLHDELRGRERPRRPHRRRRADRAAARTHEPDDVADAALAPPHRARPTSRSRLGID